MKNLLLTKQNHKRFRYFFIIWLICVLIDISFNVFAQKPPTTSNNGGERSTAMIDQQVKQQLLIYKNKLNYPKSVERYYNADGYNLAWIAKDNHCIQLYPAMMLLDCVDQFGLNVEDFHPADLLYKQIQFLDEQPNVLSSDQRAIFDLLLTDAMITFVNQLHYGKFNTDLTPAKIDEGGIGDLDAVKKLTTMGESKDFYTEIINAQPLLKEYDDLQKYMRLVRGQYLEDNYEFPEESVRKMAINMERLRWLSSNDRPNLSINIPAYTAKLQVEDTTYLFKVIVGNPTFPTLISQSFITNFTVAPDVKVPSKTFINDLLPRALRNIDYLEKNHYAIYDGKGRFVELTKKKLAFLKAHSKKYFARQSAGGENASGKIELGLENTNNVYIHGSPQPKSFLLPKRVLSKGSIRIDQIEKLAGLMLTLDGTPEKIPAMHKLIAAHQRKNFLLKTSIPVKLIYITCAMIDSQLIIYDDIYTQDRSLEMAMFGYEPILALEKKLIKKL
ncbi:MAG: L,D-transpeptidase family protein [Pedobacter sp.]|nr:L,D-transpeptidase family protein [Pedobacter sp.]